MARILFLTQVLPYPLDSGAKVRAYHMLRQLSRRHQVTLVSFTRGDDSPDAIAHLRQFCQEVATVPVPRSFRQNLIAAFRGLTTGLPMIIARDETPQMAASCGGWLARPPLMPSTPTRPPWPDMVSWPRPVQFVLPAPCSTSTTPSTSSPAAWPRASAAPCAVGSCAAKPMLSCAMNGTCAAPTMPSSPSPPKTANTFCVCSPASNRPAWPPDSRWRRFRLIPPVWIGCRIRRSPVKAP